MTGRPLHALFGEHWELVCTSGLNLLVRAPAAVTPEVMKALRSCLHDPILVARPGDPLPLRSATKAGTLVLHDVPDLTAADQQRLLAWMDDVSRQSRRTRVVSTATRSIVPLIQWGLFRAELYYRLNALYVDVHGVVPSPRSTSRSGSSAHSRA